MRQIVLDTETTGLEPSQGHRIIEIGCVEMINRRLTGVLAELHFAPTEQARRNLLRENVAEERIVVTGNTVIDALFAVRDRISADRGLQDRLARNFPWLSSGRRLVVITGHRRENFGEGMQRICRALVDLAGRWPEVSGRLSNWAKESGA